MLNLQETLGMASLQMVSLIGDKFPINKVQLLYHGTFYFLFTNLKTDFHGEIIPESYLLNQIQVKCAV